MHLSFALATLTSVLLLASGGVAWPRTALGTVTGTITPSGPPVTVTISTPGDVANVTWSGSAGDRVALKATGSNFNPTSGWAYVKILNPDGSTLAGFTGDRISNGGSDFIDTVTLPTSGTYTIKISPYNNATCSATLTLYSVPADPTGTITPGGPSVSIGTTAVGQNAWLYFSGSAGQRVALKATGSNFDQTRMANWAYVRIKKPDGSALAGFTGDRISNGGTDFIDTVTLPTSGSYSVFLNPYLDAVGAGTFTLYDVPADPTGTIIVGGPAVSIGTTTPGQNALLSFSGAAGQRVSLFSTGSNFDQTKMANWAYVRILNPDGTGLAGFTGDRISNGSSNLLDKVTLPTSGTYSVKFDPYLDGVGIGTFTLSLPSYQDLVGADRPAGYWPLDEASGATTGSDASGNNRTGMYRNLTLGVDGGLDTTDRTAASFPGTEDSDVSIANAPALGTGDFSIEAWVSTIVPGRTIVGQNAGNETSPCTGPAGLMAPGYLIEVADAPGYEGRVRVVIADSATTDPSGCTSTHRVTAYGPEIRVDDGAWHYVAVVAARSTGVTVYVDGVAATTAGATSGSLTSSASFRIGDTAASSAFDGDIDEVSVFGSQLTAAKVTDRYNSGLFYSTDANAAALTATELASAVSIATSDARFAQVVGSRPYSVTASGLWTTATSGQRLGAELRVAWSDPATIEYDWPVINYDDAEASNPPYEEGTIRTTEANVSELHILVDLQRGTMVAMEPAGDAETTSAPAAGTVDMSLTGDVAGSTLKLRRKYVGADWFWNYDFDIKGDYSIKPGSVASRSRVDWPIDLIFSDNADVNRAKELLSFAPACDQFGPGCPPSQLADRMYARVKDAFGAADPRGSAIFHGRAWDKDLGAVKGTVGCGGTKRHYRVYAPSPEVGGDDRMYNLTFEFYVIASAHKDRHEGCKVPLTSFSAAWSGDSEKVESYIADDAQGRGWVVDRNALDCLNKEDARLQRRKHFLSDGFCTKLRVPAP